nr:MAG TPA: hypothetical protein [Caudoviricetes sp.]
MDPSVYGILILLFQYTFILFILTTFLQSITYHIISPHLLSDFCKQKSTHYNECLIFL